MLQKEANFRINWDEFFKHPWIIFNYQQQSNQNNEYEKQLYSVSIGSLAESPAKIPMSNLLKNKPKSSNNLVTIVNPINIIDDFYDKIDKKKSNDNLIFQFDDEPDKKIVIKKIMDSSSILDENDYSVIN